MYFDGHNDALARLWAGGGDALAEFFEPLGHINTVTCAEGQMKGGFFAFFSPSERKPFTFGDSKGMPKEASLPPALKRSKALQSVIAQAGIAQALDRVGAVEIVTLGKDLRPAFAADDRIAMVLHLEGADGIDADLMGLEALYGMGLRSLGPVWSRPNIFGEGVPFRAGADGDTGPGLSADGKRLVARCKALGVMVDTSHLTMRGFWEVGEAGLPLVATHSNAWELCKTTRNLTDPQLKAVGESGGMVGLNFATFFLSETGVETGRATIEDCLRQLDHMVEMAGEDHVGIGSDFDGAPPPDGITSAADLPKLTEAMLQAGFGQDLIAKITHENWLSFMERQLG